MSNTYTFALDLRKECRKQPQHGRTYHVRQPVSERYELEILHELFWDFFFFFFLQNEVINHTQQAFYQEVGSHVKPMNHPFGGLISELSQRQL